MRSLKILGFALAVFAMSAVAALSVSADTFTSESTPVKLSGETETGMTDVVTITSGNISCKTVAYEKTITTPATSVTFVPLYPEKWFNPATGKEEQNCTVIGFPGVIHTNGCHYKFFINAAAPTTQGTVSVDCPTGSEIIATAESVGTVRCTIHIGTQTLPANSVTYSNTGSGATREVTVAINVVSALGSLTYKHTAGTGLGACKTGSATNGSFTAKALITGTNDVGGSGHVGVFVS